MNAVVLAAVLLAALIASVPAAAGKATPLEPNTPDGAFQIEIAIGCGSTDVKSPQYYWWTGEIYGRRAGEPDRHLFNVQGVNPRACRFVDDPDRGGRGYQAAARELMLYLDPVTNEVLRTWQNPWTGEEVEVIQMINDPASMREPRFPRDAQGHPAEPTMTWEPAGNVFVSSRAKSYFRDSPLGGNYQQYVGGKYRVMELFGHTIARADVVAWRPGRRIPYTATWTRISEWLPWMKMAGREGEIVLMTQGRTTMDFGDLPKPLRNEIETHYPLMRQTPAFDDPRPFQTSWDALQKELDRRRR